MPESITTADLAKLLGLTTRRIRQLAQAGTIPQLGRGRFDPSAAIPAYCAYLQEAWSKRTPTGEQAKEKLRLTREQADKAALANEKARGLVTPTEDVERAWVAFCVDLRAKLLAIPARVVSRAALDRRTAAILDDELRQAMGELADAK